MLLAEMSIDPVIVINRWFHIFAAMVAVGGTVFLRLVLHPTAKGTIPPEVGSQFSPALIRRWARFVHTCILVLILSGVYNTIVQFRLHKGQPLYHSMWGVKVLLALALFFIAIAVTGRSAAFEGMRQKRPMWMATNVALAAVIVLLSNILKNIPQSVAP